LTTSYPTVVRMSPKDDLKNDHSRARWMMLLGSGVHGYDGRAAMYSSLFGVLLVQQGTAPSYVQMPMLDKASSPLTYKSSYMGDLITFDRDLDFRSDAVYGGRAITGDGSCSGSGWSACGTGLGYWTGKMYRLTMGKCTTAPCSVLNWGVIDSGYLLPTEMVTAVPIGGTPVSLGPVTAGSSVTLDNSGNTWVFFGTGRFMSAADKTDQHAQYLVGVKDSVMSGCTQSTVSSCHNENLMDVTNAAICVSCASGNQVQGVGSVSTFTSLIDNIQGNSAAGIPAKDGWVIQLTTNSGSTLLGAERSIVSPTLIGGAVFFPTFTPSNDVCVATGTSQIFGLYYLTGTGYPDPIFGVNGSGQAVRAVSGGEGVASSVAIQIGSEPTGMAGFFQSSNSAINKITPKPPATLWSQFMAWINQRV
jgi:type IV pilus assembly protein PilY1